MKPVVHYPKDGVTYMKGQCGANSTRSTDVIKDVTCEKCKALLAAGRKQFRWIDYEL